MEKVFKNKKFTYIIIGILLALQLTQSIANWVGGGFNGGSLILCILMLGLLTLVGVGISKKNKLLTIVSGTSILSVVIYVLTSSYSGMIQEWIDGKIRDVALILGGIFASIGILCLIGNLVFEVLNVSKINKSLKTVNTIFSLIATVMFIVVIIFAIIAKPTSMSATLKVYLLSRDFFAMFIALLIPCVWHQLEVKE